MGIENRTHYPLEIVVIPANISRTVGTSKSLSDNNGIYKLSPNSCSYYPNKTKKDDILKISYLYKNTK